MAGVAGTFAACGLVAILSVCLTIYGIATFKEGAPSSSASLTLTGREKTADKLQVRQINISFPILEVSFPDAVGNILPLTHLGCAAPMENSSAELLIGAKNLCCCQQYSFEWRDLSSVTTW